MYCLRVRRFQNWIRFQSICVLYFEYVLKVLIFKHTWVAFSHTCVALSLHSPRMNKTYIQRFVFETNLVDIFVLFRYMVRRAARIWSLRCLQSMRFSITWIYFRYVLVTLQYDFFCLGIFYTTYCNTKSREN